MSALLPSLLDPLFIFPLPEVQLFPGALLPLHVFEPRYRAMMRDCLSSTKLMALPMLEPGFEADYEGRPAVVQVCGVGEIIESRLYPDGRYDLLLRGRGRVRIVEELPPEQLYRRVRAVRLDDRQGPEQALSTGLRALRVLCDRLASALPSGGDTLSELARQESEPGAVADVLAAAVITNAAERQSVLEELDLVARLDKVSTAVADLVGRFHGGAEPSAGSN